MVHSTSRCKARGTTGQVYQLPTYMLFSLEMLRLTVPGACRGHPGFPAWPPPVSLAVYLKRQFL